MPSIRDRVGVVTLLGMSVGATSVVLLAVGVTPKLVVIARLVVFLLAGSYVLSSYVVWVLPVTGWRARAGISRAVLIWSVLVTIAYQSVRALPNEPQELVVWLMSSVTLAFAAAALVALSVAATRRITGPRTTRVAGTPELVEI